MDNHDRHFVFCAAIPYQHSLSGRTRLLAESLAERGCRVTYLELPCLRGLLRAPEAQSTPLCVKRLAPLPGFRRISQHLPRCLWLGRMQRRLHRVAVDAEHTVLVVSAPFWQPILESHTRARVCYDYLDAVEVHAQGADLDHMRQLDDRLLARADLITPVSEHLAQNIAERYPAANLQVVPNGVPESWLTTAAEPLDRREAGLALNRPTLGFLGALFEWIDQDLLLEVASAFPQAQVALVGPTRPGISLKRLRSQPNIHFFPAQPYHQVPRWMQAFDVCLAPFRRDIVSRMADPLKVYEYLALGKPVVSTHAFGPVADRPPMYIGNTNKEFIACIRQALHENTGQEHQRKSYASRHTWQARSQALLSALHESTLRRAA